MAIKDLEARQGNVNLELEIVEKGDIREFEKFGKKGKVCNAVAKDATGNIKLTLWNDDIDKISQGDSVKIENGWVGEWQGELQLSTGKFGKIEVIESKSNASMVSSDEKEESEVLSGSKSDVGEHILTEDEKLESEVLNGNSTDRGEHILTEDEKVEEESLEELEEEPIMEEEISDDEEETEKVDK